MASLSRSPAAAAPARSTHRRQRGRRRRASPMAGSGRSPPKLLADAVRRAVLAGVAALLLAGVKGPHAGGAELASYKIVGDAIPAPLSKTAGSRTAGSKTA